VARLGDDVLPICPLIHWVGFLKITEVSQNLKKMGGFCSGKSYELILIKWKMLIYLKSIWYIAQPFGIFYVHLVILWSVGIFSHFGMF
jgi:hypothetical protein